MTSPPAPVALRFIVAFLLLAPCPVAAGMHPRIGEGEACAAKQCHAAFEKAPAGTKSVHEPVTAGECRACHELAPDAGPAFVRGYPGAEMNTAGRAAKAWDAVLCGGCHGEKLTATAFMSGGRNLHDVHVAAGGRGRACLTCHDAHAAPQEHLLRTQIAASGTLRLPQSFRAQPRGGRCQTGCHAPKSYVRD